MLKCMIRCSLAVFFLANTLTLTAQTNELINSGELLTQGQKLHDDGKYKQALDLYKKIPRSDTNYVRALNELSLSSYYDSNFTASKAYAELGLKLFPEKANQWYNLLANALDDLGKKDEALQYYDKIITSNPNDYQAWFNKGITLYNLKKYTDAKKCLQQTVLIYPFYTSAHYWLGNISIEEGNLVNALLSFSTTLILNPEGRYLNSTINKLSAIAAVKDEIAAKANARKPSDEDAFDLQQEIILSKIALDTKYKLNTDVEDPITRQLQVLLEKLEYNAGDKGFWMQYYVPYYRQLFAQNKFNLLVNYMFSGLTIKSVQAFNKKNKKEIDDFINDESAYFNDIKETRVLNADSRKSAPMYYLFNNRVFSGKGKREKNGNENVLIGPWEFYFENGQVKSKGTLNAKQEKEGEWIFYHDNGKLKEKSTYKNDELDGKSFSWFDNGVLYSDEQYIIGKLQGEIKKYYYNGMLHTISQYNNGQKNGIENGYTVFGTLNYTALLKDDQQDGETIFYHPNGKKSSSTFYLAGKADGPFKKWNEDGVLIQEGNYKEDKAVGGWKTYFPSSSVKEISNYTNGDLDGEYKEFHDNGKLKQQLNYVKGNAEGKQTDYGEDGKPYIESNYEKGRLKEIDFYDKQGKISHSFTTRKGAGNITFFDEDGIKTNDGYFTKDALRDGKSTYYFSDGTVSATANYKEGKLNGEKINYYHGGTISEKINYTDDEEDGYYLSYHPTGKLKYEGWYVKGNKQGAHKSYNALGNLISISYYKNNDEDGFTEYYNPNGKIDYEQRFDESWIKHVTQFDTSGKSVSDFEVPPGDTSFVFKHFNGKDIINGNYENYYLHGTYRIYFFDGSVSALQFYKYGKKDSIYRQYYYGGQVSAEGQYTKGDKEGNWKYYYPNGKPSSQEQYIHGVLNGKATNYNEDGSLDKEYTYVDNELEGPYKIYGEDNKLVAVLYYHADNLVSYSFEGKDGKLIAPVLLKGGSGLVTAYYSNGKKSVEIAFRESIIDGIRKFYFSNGKSYVDGTRISGEDNGSKKIYAVNGQLLKDENWLYDELHGLQKYYYANGLIKAEENWYAGEQHGISKYYDETGKLKQTQTYYYGTLLSAQ